MKKYVIIAFPVVFIILILLIYNKRQNNNVPFTGDQVIDSLLAGKIKEMQATLSKDFDYTRNIASPVEIAYSIKKYNLGFSNDYLLNTDIDLYQKSTEMALALGGIGVDALYLTFYKKTAQLMVPFQQLNKLTNNLRISQYFDFFLIKKLCNDNLSPAQFDSLKFIVSRNMNEMQTYLVEGNRAHLGVYMVAGAWLEGLYMLTRASLETGNTEIWEKVAEQKVFINELFKLIGATSKNRDILKLKEKLAPMYEILNSIEFTYRNIGEPVMTYDEYGNETPYQYQESIAHIDNQKLLEIDEECLRLRRGLFKLGQ